MKAVLIILILVIVTLVGLRLNKLRRDARRATSVFTTNPVVESRPTIRILGSDQPELPSLEVQRPSVDPTRNYVFGENAEIAPSMPNLSTPREQWALSRSANRSKLPRGSSKIVLFALGVVVVLIVIGTLITQR